MGLQAHPCGSKRPFEGLEEPAAGRCQQQQHYQQEDEDCNSAPSAKQQCTIRVGLEAPTEQFINSSTPNDNSETTAVLAVSGVTWYRDVVQQQQHPSSTPDYDSYVNGFNAAEARASTPYTSSTSSYYSSSSSSNNSETAVLVPVSDYSSHHSAFITAGTTNEVYSSVNVYQNLSSMQPVVLGGESLADRFERVCNSPRPYVQQQQQQYNGDGAYSYGNDGSMGGSKANNDERYWTFGYSSHCPKKPGSSTTVGGGISYAKCGNSYGYDNGFSGGKVLSTGVTDSSNGQTIQRDENGKSYLELGANAAVPPVQPEWRVQQHTWPPPQPTANVPPPHPTSVKSCSKCGNVLTGGNQQPRPCYKHQRLSVLSLSMHKLNRYRQCSDPSLHRSVLICNTLRCIEDEMEREGLSTNESTTSTTVLGDSGNNCDTCCCSHCGTVLINNNINTSEAPPASHYAPVVSNNYESPPQMPTPPPTTVESNFATSTPITTTTTTTTTNENNNMASEMELTANSKSSSSTSSSVSNADEDDSGFGDEDSRDIDWSSVFSMSTTSGFDVSSNNSSSISTCSNSAGAVSTVSSHNHSSSESYGGGMCDSIASASSVVVDPSSSLFAASSSALLTTTTANESAHWKNHHHHHSTSSCNNNNANSCWTASDAADFSTYRWNKSEMGDELDPSGFVTHIMVGS